MALTQLPKHQPHHKKAYGGHHRHSKHYLKTYSPYLPLLLLVLVGLAVNVFWTSRTGVLGATTNVTASQLLSDTNLQRSHNNEDDLALNNKLNAAAQAKANDMVDRGYWSHTTPDGKTPWNFITNSGYTYYTAGENLAYGFANAEGVVDGWMNSREHRANMLSSDFTEVGFGIASAPNYLGHGKTTVVVAMYAEPAIVVGTDTASASTDLPVNIPYHKVSRVQLMTHGQAPWSVALVTVVTIMSIVWFMIRHVKAWRRVFVESEEFVIHHKFLDILIVATTVVGFLLTRSAGFIH